MRRENFQSELFFNQWEKRITTCAFLQPMRKDDYNLCLSSSNENRGFSTWALLQPMRREDFQSDPLLHPMRREDFQHDPNFIKWEERIFNLILFFIQWEKSIFKLIPSSANEKRGITYLSFSGHMSTIPVTRDSTMQNSLSMPIVWNESMQWKVLLRLFSMLRNYSFK